MTKENFKKWLDSVPKEETEPFCPFNHSWFGYGYCNEAYSMHCYTCEFSQEWMAGKDLGKI